MRSALDTKILEALAHGPLTARELAPILGMADSTVRGLVNNLRAEGLITAAVTRLRPRGAATYVYQLAPRPPAPHPQRLGRW